MKLLKRKPSWEFKEAELAENTKYLGNPGCGWYHIHAFSLDTEPDMEELYWCVCKEDTLALVILDIGAYREEPLPEIVLDRTEEILDFFRKQEKELIVRVVYDREGKGLEREPYSIQTVERHMRQLGTILRRFAGEILVVQGLLVGSWGEMHGSKFLSKEKLRRLFEVFQDALGEEICIAVRTPGQWRLLHGEGTKAEAVRTGLFDDGMFGSFNNLGTYGTMAKEHAGWEQEWCREDELDFIGGLGEHLPYGGEAVGTDECGELQKAAAEMRLTHTSYLNSTYDEQILRRWRQAVWMETGVWNGCSGYDYIGSHLGYRFVIREVSWKCGGYRKTPRIEVEIANVGFAPPYEEAELLAVWETDGECREERLQVDRKTLLPGRRTAVKIPLPESVGSETHRLFLTMRRKRDGRIIRFANQESGERVFLGLLVNG